MIDGLDELNRARVLLYLKGHTSEEIADIVGISTGNVTTRMNRLRNELQRGFARLEGTFVLGQIVWWITFVAVIFASAFGANDRRP